MDHQLEHEVVEQILEDLRSTLGAAESHGLLCGLLCVLPTQRAKARWFSELLDSAGVEAGQLQAHADSLKQLEQLFEASVQEINSADLGFDLLIPAESNTVASRTAALGGWCSGFCAGVGFGVNADRTLPDDTSELLDDFSKISRVDPHSEEADEESLVELMEYVRMGVLLINEELQPAPDTPSSVH